MKMAAPWMDAPWMDALWMADYFEQVKKCWVFSWIWASQKFTLHQNSFRRNWTPEQLSGLLIHVTATPPWFLRLVKVSTSSKLYLDCFQLPTFCSGIQFFYLPPFPNTASQTTFGYLLLTVQHLCDLQDAMPRHWSPSASHPTLT